jgi:hypothetical protein
MDIATVGEMIAANARVPQIGLKGEGREVGLGIDMIGIVITMGSSQTETKMEGEYETEREVLVEVDFITGEVCYTYKQVLPSTRLTIPRLSIEIR